MSLAEQLSNLDSDLLESALASILMGKIAFGSVADVNDMFEMVDRYPSIATLPSVLSHNLGFLGVDGNKLVSINQGASLILCVLVEYAELENMQNRFPGLAES